MDGILRAEFIFWGACAVVPLVAGLAVCLIIDISAGPHREPLWLKRLLAAGCGVMIVVILQLLSKHHLLPIAEAMALGTASALLGAWLENFLRLRYEAHIESRRPRRKTVKNTGAQGRDPWRTQQAGTNKDPIPPISGSKTTTRFTGDCFSTQNNAD